MVEIWRTEWRGNAYTDQTGITHAGYVVFEQVLVEFTGDTFDQYEHYSKKKYDSGRVFKDVRDRIYLCYANLLDYTGGKSFVLVYDPLWDKAEAMGFDVIGDRRTPKVFRQALDKPLGYCYPDGSGPIKRLKEPDDTDRIS